MLHSPLAARGWRLPLLLSCSVVWQSVCVCENSSINAADAQYSTVAVPAHSISDASTTTMAAHSAFHIGASTSLATMLCTASVSAVRQLLQGIDTNTSPSSTDHTTTTHQQQHTSTHRVRTRLVWCNRRTGRGWCVALNIPPWSVIARP